MATKDITDAIVAPQDEGTGLSNQTDAINAAGVSVLAEYNGGSHIGEGLEVVGRDGTNDTITIGSGWCFIEDDSTSTAGNRQSGGSAGLQSTSSSGYDTELPGNNVYVVVIPSQVTISVTSGSLNEVWVNITDVTSNNSVEMRTSGGGGTTAEPSDTYLKIAEANPNDSSTDEVHNWNPQVQTLTQPGDVQAEIDRMEAIAGGSVFLDPTKTYMQPSSPWEVKSDVTLHFNGAKLIGDGSLNGTDMIHMHPGGQIIAPHIDLYDSGDAYTPSNNYNANVFVCDTQYGEYFANGTGIRRGLIEGETDGGTGLFLNVTQNQTFITHNRFEITIDNARDFRNYSSIGTAVHMKADNGLDDAWINGVHLYGHWNQPKHGWVLEGDTTAGGESSTLNQVNYNTARIQYQPDPVNNTSEEMFWVKSDTWAKRNVIHGMIWDLYQDDAVRIDSTYDNSASRATAGNAANCQNGFDLFYNGQHITNNNVNPFMVNDLTSWKHDEY